MKYYAVKKGRKTGIFNSWDECKAQIDKFSGAVYKSFTNIKDAKNFIENKEETKVSYKDSAIAYIDGSYDNKIKRYGSGGIIFINNESHEFSFSDNKDYMLSMRNVSGEILASEYAIKYAIKKGQKSIIINYDYEGIEKWCNGDWKANKQGTIEYKEFYESIKNKIKVKFIKVKAHSGDTYNELADKLAKESLLKK